MTDLITIISLVFHRERTQGETGQRPNLLKIPFPSLSGDARQSGEGEFKPKT